MTNPFDLPGPQFLIFYLVLAAALFALLAVFRHFGEPDASTSVQLTDPYPIAYLRGGADEVLRVATAGLVDRGLLQAEADRLQVAEESAAALIRDPIERAVLENFRTEKHAQSLFRRDLRRVCNLCIEPLARLGLIPDASARLSQWGLCLVVGLILLAVGGVKLYLASRRGRVNTDFLNWLMLASLAVAYLLGPARRTRRGTRFLNDMFTLLAPLRARAESLGPRTHSKEVLLLAAVCGVSALPPTTFRSIRQLFRTQPVGPAGWNPHSGMYGVMHSCGGGGGHGCGGCGGG